MTEKDMVNKMVSELQHNHRKYSDGCGDLNFDLLASEMAVKFNLMRRDDVEAPEWIWNAAVNASEIHKKNRKQQFQERV